uniref:1-phosphatidylinositol 4-kinase n=1 Tax=Chromera velia CCMP2878 TaxID=1169474 RepID=A0A0G4FDZ8_9ALVE|eukprot:Cvel_16532.t1-p1 / transcript=Cvel_16532.t1 / gene=Cvel_16532 / organism=Chromera_velia_CCMP2878 / gene_product=Phosphatidylinositol 4-kinase stt4, putative / transcript_product=Phosphatidylinositol 4-kinase stt4, putative / location=Cvel_scaffold1277:4705-34366(+) / protein_length=3779 / sequence_SO=supercontig / SO=protein_coding / is_pseudo=false
MRGELQLSEEKLEAFLRLGPRPLVEQLPCVPTGKDIPVIHTESGNAALRGAGGQGAGSRDKDRIRRVALTPVQKEAVSAFGSFVCSARDETAVAKTVGLLFDLFKRLPSLAGPPAVPRGEPGLRFVHAQQRGGMARKEGSNTVRGEDLERTDLEQLGYELTCALGGVYIRGVREWSRSGPGSVHFGRGEGSGDEEREKKKSLGHRQTGAVLSTVACAISVLVEDTVCVWLERCLQSLSATNGVKWRHEFWFLFGALKGICSSGVPLSAAAVLTSVKACLECARSSNRRSLKETPSASLELYALLLSALSRLLTECARPVRVADGGGVARSVGEGKGRVLPPTFQTEAVFPQEPVAAANRGEQEGLRSSSDGTIVLKCAPTSRRSSSVVFAFSPPPRQGCGSLLAETPVALSAWLFESPTAAVVEDGGKFRGGVGGGLQQNASSSVAAAGAEGAGEGGVCSREEALRGLAVAACGARAALAIAVEGRVGQGGESLSWASEARVSLSKMMKDSFCLESWGADAIAAASLSLSHLGREVQRQARAVGEILRDFLLFEGRGGPSGTPISLLHGGTAGTEKAGGAGGARPAFGPRSGSAWDLLGSGEGGGQGALRGHSPSLLSGQGGPSHSHFVLAILSALTSNCLFHKNCQEEERGASYGTGRPLDPAGPFSSSDCPPLPPCFWTTGQEAGGGVGGLGPGAREGSRSSVVALAPPLVGLFPRASSFIQPPSPQRPTKLLLLGRSARSFYVSGRVHTGMGEGLGGGGAGAQGRTSADSLGSDLHGGGGAWLLEGRPLFSWWMQGLGGRVAWALSCLLRSVSRAVRSSGVIKGATNLGLGLTGVSRGSGGRGMGLRAVTREKTQSASVLSVSSPLRDFFKAAAVTADEVMTKLLAVLSDGEGGAGVGPPAGGAASRVSKDGEGEGGSVSEWSAALDRRTETQLQDLVWLFRVATLVSCSTDDPSVSLTWMDELCKRAGAGIEQAAKAEKKARKDKERGDGPGRQKVHLLTGPVLGTLLGSMTDLAIASSTSEVFPELLDNFLELVWLGRKAFGPLSPNGAAGKDPNRKGSVVQGAPSVPPSPLSVSSLKAEDDILRSVTFQLQRLCNAEREWPSGAQTKLIRTLAVLSNASLGSSSDCLPPPLGVLSGLPLPLPFSLGGRLSKMNVGGAFLSIDAKKHQRDPKALEALRQGRDANISATRRMEDLDVVLNTPADLRSTRPQYCAETGTVDSFVLLWASLTVSRMIKGDPKNDQLFQKVLQGLAVRSPSLVYLRDLVAEEEDEAGRGGDSDEGENEKEVEGEERGSIKGAGAGTPLSAHIASLLAELELVAKNCSFLLSLPYLNDEIVHSGAHPDLSICMGQLVRVVFQRYVSRIRKQAPNAKRFQKLSEDVTATILCSVHRSVKVREECISFLEELLDNFPEVLWSDLAVCTLLEMLDYLGEVVKHPFDCTLTVYTFCTNESFAVLLPAEKRTCAEVLNRLATATHRSLTRAFNLSSNATRGAVGRYVFLRQRSRHDPHMLNPLSHKEGLALALDVCTQRQFAPSGMLGLDDPTKANAKRGKKRKAHASSHRGMEGAAKGGDVKGSENGEDFLDRMASQLRRLFGIHRHHDSKSARIASTLEVHSALMGQLTSLLAENAVDSTVKQLVDSVKGLTDIQLAISRGSTDIPELVTSLFRRQPTTTETAQPVPVVPAALNGQTHPQTDDKEGDANVMTAFVAPFLSPPAAVQAQFQHAHHSQRQPSLPQVQPQTHPVRPTTSYTPHRAAPAPPQKPPLAFSAVPRTPTDPMLDSSPPIVATHNGHNSQQRVLAVSGGEDEENISLLLHPENDNDDTHAVPRDTEQARGPRSVRQTSTAGRHGAVPPSPGDAAGFGPSRRRASLFSIGSTMLIPPITPLPPQYHQKGAAAEHERRDRERETPKAHRPSDEAGRAREGAGGQKGGGPVFSFGLELLEAEAEIHDVYFQVLGKATAALLLLENSDGEETDDEAENRARHQRLLVGALVHEPMRLLMSQPMQAAVFCWEWVAASSQRLRLLLLGELRIAWARGIQGSRGIFSGGDAEGKSSVVQRDVLNRFFHQNSDPIDEVLKQAVVEGGRGDERGTGPAVRGRGETVSGPAGRKVRSPSPTSAVSLSVVELALLQEEGEGEGAGPTRQSQRVPEGAVNSPPRPSSPLKGGGGFDDLSEIELRDLASSLSKEPVLPPGTSPSHFMQSAKEPLALLGDQKKKTGAVSASSVRRDLPLPRPSALEAEFEQIRQPLSGAEAMRRRAEIMTDACRLGTSRHGGEAEEPAGTGVQQTGGGAERVAVREEEMRAQDQMVSFLHQRFVVARETDFEELQLIAGFASEALTAAERRGGLATRSAALHPKFSLFNILLEAAAIRVRVPRHASTSTRSAALGTADVTSTEEARGGMGMTTRWAHPWLSSSQWWNLVALTGRALMLNFSQRGGSSRSMWHERKHSLETVRIVQVLAAAMRNLSLLGPSPHHPPVTVPFEDAHLLDRPPLKGKGQGSVRGRGGGMAGPACSRGRANVYPTLVALRSASFAHLPPENRQGPIDRYRRHLLFALIRDELERVVTWANPLCPSIVKLLKTVPQVDADALSPGNKWRAFLEQNIRRVVQAAFYHSPGLAVDVPELFRGSLRKAAFSEVVALFRLRPHAFIAFPRVLHLLASSVNALRLDLALESFARQASHFASRNLQKKGVTGVHGAVHAMAGASAKLDAIGRSLTPFLYFSALGMSEILSLFQRCFKEVTFARQLAVRALSHYPPAVLRFYLPQLVQVLRHDTGLHVERALRDMCRLSPLLTHQLTFILTAEEQPTPHRIPLRGPDTLPALSRRLKCRVLSEMGPMEQHSFMSQFRFFDSITAISGMLKPYKSDQRRAKIKEELSKIQLPPQAPYLPTNPNCQVVAIDLNSGTPMQSAAKVPILVTFITAPYIGIDIHFIQMLLGGGGDGPGEKERNAGGALSVHMGGQRDRTERFSIGEATQFEGVHSLVGGHGGVRTNSSRGGSPSPALDRDRDGSPTQEEIPQHPRGGKVPVPARMGRDVVKTGVAGGPPLEGGASPQISPDRGPGNPSHSAGAVTAPAGGPMYTPGSVFTRGYAARKQSLLGQLNPPPPHSLTFSPVVPPAAPFSPPPHARARTESRPGSRTVEREVEVSRPPSTGSGGIHLLGLAGLGLAEGVAMFDGADGDEPELREIGVHGAEGEGDGDGDGGFSEMGVEGSKGQEEQEAVGGLSDKERAFLRGMNATGGMDRSQKRRREKSGPGKSSDAAGAGASVSFPPRISPFDEPCIEVPSGSVHAGHRLDFGASASVAAEKGVEKGDGKSEGGWRSGGAGGRRRRIGGQNVFPESDTEKEGFGEEDEEEAVEGKANLEQKSNGAGDPKGKKEKEKDTERRPHSATSFGQRLRTAGAGPERSGSQAIDRNNNHSGAGRGLIRPPAVSVGGQKKKPRKGDALSHYKASTVKRLALEFQAALRVKLDRRRKNMKQKKFKKKQKYEGRGGGMDMESSDEDEYEGVDESGDGTRQSCIFKVHDDCRQDELALQIMQLFQVILDEADLPLCIFPYAVLSNRTGAAGDIGGIIEVIPGCKSRHQVGKLFNMSLAAYYRLRFGNEHTASFQRAKSNFIRSLAAYAVICFILQIKDRHNGNLLIGNEGHIYHIDFGFLFDFSPGKDMRFEKAPFKLTKEMIDIMGGAQSAEAFQYFASLCVKGYLALRAHGQQLLRLVDLMLDSGLQCFKPMSLANLRWRFQLDTPTTVAARFMRRQVALAYRNWTTTLYDRVQKLQQGIAY